MYEHVPNALLAVVAIVPLLTHAVTGDVPVIVVLSPASNHKAHPEISVGINGRSVGGTVRKGCTADKFV
jgi:hypothetical protein